MIRIVPARLTHVGPIASKMRHFDVRECEALGRSPKEALRTGLRCSLSAFTAIDEIPVAMFGVVPEALMGGVGRVWFLGTDQVHQCPRELLVIGRRMIAGWLDSFSRLENVVSTENEAAVRLLEKWGFTVDDKKEDHRGVEFVAFWRERAAIQAEEIEEQFPAAA